MASGRLGAAELSATTNTAIYTVPASTVTSCKIYVVNKNTTTARDIRIMLLDGAIGTLANEDYIYYDYSLAAKTTLEISGIVLGASAVVGAYASDADITVQVVGYEETA